VAIKVRTCKTLAEFKQAAGAIAEYGGWDVEDDAERFLRCHPLDHMHAAFDGRRAVGGAGAFPFDLSVPGGSVACAGVTVVGVYPTHRRQGILTAMMRAQLDDAHDRGEPIAALWASDERIYGRYG
jgi:predicted acetyltransferase